MKEIKKGRDNRRNKERKKLRSEGKENQLLY